MADDVKIVLPEEYKEKGWVKSVQAEDGSIDPLKVWSKIDGQESLLGKKSVPTKDATDEEWNEFNSKVVKEYNDGDYDPLLDGLKTKSEMILELKKNGVPPRTAKVIADLYKRESEQLKAEITEKQYSEDEFKSEIKKELSEAEYSKAVAALQKHGQWDRISKASNAGAVAAVIAAGKIASAYGVEDKPGKVGGESVVTQGNGKGVCQEYVNRIFALESEGKSHDDALKQAKAEYSVVD